VLRWAGDSCAKETEENEEFPSSRKESHRETSSAREQGLIKGETFPN